MERPKAALAVNRQASRRKGRIGMDHAATAAVRGLADDWVAQGPVARSAAVQGSPMGSVSKQKTAPPVQGQSRIRRDSEIDEPAGALQGSPDWTVFGSFDEPHRPVSIPGRTRPWHLAGIDAEGRTGAGVQVADDALPVDRRKASLAPRLGLRPAADQQQAGVGAPRQLIGQKVGIDLDGGAFVAEIDQHETASA